MTDYTWDTAKTNKARTIDMDLNIMMMLLELVRSNDAHKMKYRTVVDYFHDESFLFQRTNGYPFIGKNLSSRMKRLLKFCEFDKSLTWHSFGHTHISLLTESGVELSAIMERVGYVDEYKTLKVYTLVTEKIKVKSIENLTAKHNNIIGNLRFKYKCG